MERLVEAGAKFDAIIADVPQGITRNNWDTPIPLEPMWEKLYRLKRDKHTPIAIFTNQPFTSRLIGSNEKDFKYMRYWQKSRPTNFLNAKIQPLRDVEEIAIFSQSEITELSVFYEKQCYYDPQFFEGKPLHGMGNSYKHKELSNNNYNKFNSRENPSANRTGDTKKYPRQLMSYKNEHPVFHPTQKPRDLMEELILTYTKEGDTILDFTAGSMSTGLMCEELGRKWVCIELEERMCEIGANRFNN